MVRGSSGSRRRTSWASSPVTNQTISSASKFSFDLLTNFEVAGASYLGSTVARIHGSVYINFNTADTAPSAYIGYIVNSAETAALQTQPDPATAQQDDWMLLRLLAPGLSPSTLTETAAIFTGFDVDIRSKRKIHQMGEKLICTISNVGTSPIVVTMFHRTLVMLP